MKNPRLAPDQTIEYKRRLKSIIKAGTTNDPEAFNKAFSDCAAMSTGGVMSHPSIVAGTWHFDIDHFDSDVMIYPQRYKALKSYCKQILANQNLLRHLNKDNLMIMHQLILHRRLRADVETELFIKRVMET